MHPLWRSLCLLLLVAASSNAQVPDFKFRHLGVRDGFSTNELGNIFRDSRGFLWVTSFNGLNRYDGHQVIIYRHQPEDPKSIATNATSNVVEDSLKDIWIGCANGFISRYNFSTNTFTNFNIKSPGDTTFFFNKQTCVIYYAGNNVWAERDAELYHFDYSSQKFVHFETASLKNRVQPARDFVFSITADQKIYFRTHGELMVMNADGRKMHHYFQDSSASRFFNNFIISTLYVDGSGDIWFSEWDRFRTYFYSTSENSFTNVIPDAPPVASRVVNLFIPYGAHQLLAASYSDGLWLIDADKKKVLKYYRYDPNSPSSLSGVGIGSILLDKQGTLWLASAQLDYYNPINNEFRFISKDPRHNPFYDLTHFPDACEDSSHRLWFAEFVGGVCEIVADSSHMLRHPFHSGTTKDANNNAIYSLMALDRNHLLVGLQNGVSEFDISKREMSDTIPFPGEGKILSHHTTVQILKDKNGLLWLATARNGIVIYDQKKNTCYRLYADSPDPKRKLPGEWITQMATDTKGNIWIAAKEFYGLVRINPDSMIIHAFPLPSDYFEKSSAGLLYNLLIDGDSVIWLGTWGYGLLKYEINSRAITIYDSKKGLCNDIVSSVTTDHHGNLWICTANGLSNFDKKKKIFRNYFTDQGLPQNDLINFILCSSDGNIYFGVKNGIAAFNPDSLKGELLPPQTFLTSVEANGQRLPSVESNLRLSYSQHNVAFEFSTVNFIDPDHDQYSYKLDGYDEDWNIAGSRQYAAYTNLPGGDYTFEVRAANIDGVWNDQPTRISLHIATPFWHAWWFYLLIVLLISSVLYLIYSIRLNRVLAIERMRTRISRDLHDDVGSALSSINIWSDVARSELKKDAQRSEEYLQRIHSSSQNMLDTMSDIIWAINPVNDTVERLLARMKSYASEMLEPKNIDFEFLVPKEIKKVTIPMQYRREWYLIFKEAINNGAKYSEATKISIRISFLHHVLILQIRDNGKGFDPSLQAESNSRGGNGLRNMRKRAEQMKAQFEINSSLGKGAEILLKQRIT